jgi:hypothetical protein
LALSINAGFLLLLLFPVVEAPTLRTSALPSSPSTVEPCRYNIEELSSASLVLLESAVSDCNAAL